MVLSRSRFSHLFLIAIALFLVSPLRAEAASLSFTPSSSTFQQGCSARIDVMLDTQGVSTNAADMVVLFNSSELDIEDQNAAIPGAQVKPGSVYEVYAGNVVDNAQGKIMVTAFSVMGNFNGSGNYASIFLKSKPGVTSSTLQFQYAPGQSTDSNIADLSANDVLSSVNTGTYSFQSGPCFPDVQSPAVSGVVPVNNAVGVALNSNVSFTITDNQSGVDLTTLSIQLYNVSYSQSGPELTISGQPLNYMITINPAQDFPAATEIVLIVQASDLVGNVMPAKVFSFNKPPAPPGPPAQPVCGNGVIESGEECEPAGSVVCDSSCKAVINACLPAGEATAAGVIGQLTSSDFVGGFAETLATFGQTVGLTSAPSEIGGITLASIQTESFVCNDTRVDTVELQRTETPYAPPSDYEVIKTPFSLNCGGAYETTLNIPEEYYDVKAVKCEQGVCSDVEVSSVQSIQCGAETVVEKESVSAKTAELTSAQIEHVFDSTRYRVEAVGNVGGRTYGVGRYDEAYKYDLHASLKMLSSPVMVTRRGTTAAIEKVKLSFPVVSDPEIEARSVEIYAYDSKAEQWIVVQQGVLEGGEIRVEVNFSDYANAQGRVGFVVMGKVCVDCEKTSFDLVYQPVQGSKAAVVLVHGLAGSVADWSAITDDIRRTAQPWQVWTYGYQPERSLDENAEDLARSLQIHVDEYDVVYVVAHSTGGLVAQQALSYAHRENFINPNSFTFLKKIKKAILIGTPNDPIQSENLILTFYDYLVNTGLGNLFSLRSGSIAGLVQQRSQIPQVPGVEYFVIAGSKGLGDGFSLDRFGTAALLGDDVKNDGLVSVNSAQHVGGQYLQDQCENYWEVGANHVALLQDPSARKVVGRLISQDVSKALRDVSLFGHQNYFRLADASCASEDRYILIGKKIRREKAPDDLTCACGNGYCGVDEDEVSCPSDCANFFRKENYPWMYLIIVLALASGAGYGLKRVLRRKDKKKKK